MIRRLGTAEETVEERVVTLQVGKDMHEIMTVEF